MGGIDVIVPLAEEPVAALHEFEEICGCLCVAFVGGAFVCPDGLGHARDDFVVEMAGEEGDALLAVLLDGGHAEGGDGAAHALVGEDEFEAFEGVDALLEGDTDDLFHVAFIGEGGDGVFDGLGFSDGTEVGPGAGDVAGGEEELAGVAGDGHDGLLVVVSCDLVALDEGEAEFVPLAHEAGFEGEAVFAGFEEGGGEVVESCGGVGGGCEAVQILE